MKILIVLPLLLIAGFCFAQSTIEWQQSFGGSAYDVAHSIQQTDDGGFIVLGITESVDGDITGNHGWYDYWVVKLDSSGTLEWQQTHGGISGDYAESIIQTTDGGFIAAGYTSSNDGDVSGNHGGTDYWIVKIDVSGDIEWQKCLGGSYNDYAYSIRQTFDCGYIIAGESNSIDGDVTGNHGEVDYWIVKIDSSGTIEWQRSLGGTDYETAYDVRQTSDSGFVVAGYSSSNDGDVTGHHGNGDFWIVKLDATGALEWQRCLGGSRAETAQSIRCTFDGGYIVAGRSFSNDGDVTGHHGIDSSPDYWITKLDSSGAIEWQNSYGGINDDYTYSIEQTVDNGYIAVGYSTSTDGDVTGNHGELDFWVVRLSPTGSLIWQRSLGGSQGDFAHSVGLVDDGGYIVAGWARSSDGDITVNHGYEDVWIVKLSSDTWIEETFARPDIFALSAHPNPFNSAVRIAIDAPVEAIHELPLRIEVFDIAGHRITKLPDGGTVGYEFPLPLPNGRGDLPPTTREYIWQPDETIGSGVYLVRVRFDDKETVARVVYLK